MCQHHTTPHLRSCYKCDVIVAQTRNSFPRSSAGVGKLRHAGSMRPARVYYAARRKCLPTLDLVRFHFCLPTQCVGAAFLMATWLSVYLSVCLSR